MPPIGIKETDIVVAWAGLSALISGGGGLLLVNTPLRA